MLNVPIISTLLNFMADTPSGPIYKLGETFLPKHAEDGICIDTVIRLVLYH